MQPVAHLHCGFHSTKTELWQKSEPTALVLPEVREVFNTPQSKQQHTCFSHGLPLIHSAFFSYIIDPIHIPSLASFNKNAGQILF